MKGWLKMLLRHKSKQEVLTEELRTDTQAEVDRTKREVNLRTDDLSHLIVSTLVAFQQSKDPEHHRNRN